MRAPPCHSTTQRPGKETHTRFDLSLAHSCLCRTQVLTLLEGTPAEGPKSVYCRNIDTRSRTPQAKRRFHEACATHYNVPQGVEQICILAVQGYYVKVAGMSIFYGALATTTVAMNTAAALLGSRVEAHLCLNMPDLCKSPPMLVREPLRRTRFAYTPPKPHVRILLRYSPFDGGCPAD